MPKFDKHACTKEQFISHVLYKLQVFSDSKEDHHEGTNHVGDWLEEFMYAGEEDPRFKD